MTELNAHTTILEQLRALISDRLIPLPDEFPDDGDLYEQGLDSMALMQLILILEQEVEVHIQATDLDRKHFQSLVALADFIGRKKSK